MLTFARLVLLNFSGKFPWCSSAPLKFESHNLQHCKKNCGKLFFWVFTEQLLFHIIFWKLHFYEVTLVKSSPILLRSYSSKNDNKPLLQISETNIFDHKRFIKILFKVNEKNNSGVMGINQIRSKLLTLKKRSQFSYS